MNEEQMALVIANLATALKCSMNGEKDESECCLFDAADALDERGIEGVCDIRETGYLTDNKGVIVLLNDGTEFMVSVQQTR